MSEIANKIQQYNEELSAKDVKLIAISKTKPSEDIQEAYDAGQRDFGENKVQEMTDKQESLSKDIKWHMVGHLQRNKVKYLAPYVHLIHSVDSKRLLKEINKQARKVERTIDVLLQIHIAKEESKFGFDESELLELLNDDSIKEYENVRIVGLMGMATFTDSKALVIKEFNYLHGLFEKVKQDYDLPNIQLTELSMGMSGDYQTAIECGSTMVRLGSSIFGERNYG